MAKRAREEGTTHKLLYFDFPGKAEAIRLALTHAGVAFEDHRFADRAEFQALKASGRLQFGQVPERCFQFDQGRKAACSVVREHITTGAEPFAQVCGWCGFVEGAEAKHTFDPSFMQAVKVALGSRRWSNSELIDQHPVDAEITGVLHQLSSHFISH